VLYLKAGDGGEADTILVGDIADEGLVGLLPFSERSRGVIGVYELRTALTSARAATARRCRAVASAGHIGQRIAADRTEPRQFEPSSVAVRSVSLPVEMLDAPRSTGRARPDLNFWASWCSICDGRREHPAQALGAPMAAALLARQVPRNWWSPNAITLRNGWTRAG
jgi:hypothetical protein